MRVFYVQKLLHLLAIAVAAFLLIQQSTICFRAVNILKNEEGSCRKALLSTIADGTAEFNILVSSDAALRQWEAEQKQLQMTTAPISVKEENAKSTQTTPSIITSTQVTSPIPRRILATITTNGSFPELPPTTSSPTSTSRRLTANTKTINTGTSGKVEEATLHPDLGETIEPLPAVGGTAHPEILVDKPEQELPDWEIKQITPNEAVYLRSRVCIALTWKETMGVDQTDVGERLRLLQTVLLLLLTACFFVLANTVHFFFARDAPGIVQTSFKNAVLMLLWVAVLTMLEYFRKNWSTTWNNFDKPPTYPAAWLAVEVLAFVVAVACIIETCFHHICRYNLYTQRSAGVYSVLHNYPSDPVYKPTTIGSSLGIAVNSRPAF